jgi:hypothetical protein
MDTLTTAISWLSQGVNVLPVQPGTKYLVKGFGQHKDQVRTPGQAFRWWGHGKPYNLAVVAPENLLVLDFDSNQLFFEWQDQLPFEYALTYHETSRRGWHVFYWCSAPADLKLVKGVEIKRVCMVAPSRLDRFVYRPIDLSCPILTVGDWEKVLLPLLSEPYQPTQPREVATVPSGPNLPGEDLVSRVKKAVPIMALASRLTKLRPSDGGHGRWFVGCCPFHEDKHPSFWVDTLRGLWGCRAGCGRGDVINLYAKSHDISLHEALKQLAGELWPVSR